MREYPIFKLGDDAYVEWVGSCDAPGSRVMTYAEAFARTAPERMVRVESDGHSFVNRGPASPEELVAGNRAGPDESCLSVRGILRMYAPGAQLSKADLTPADIEPFWTNDFADDGSGEDEHGPIYVWVPWRPGEEPEAITETTDLRDRSTRIFAEEHAKLVAE